MARKTIFEQLNGAMSFKKEIGRIEELIHSKNGVRVESLSSNVNEPSVHYYPFEAFIDDMVFKKWKHRGTCIHCKDMRECLNIQNIVQKDDPAFEDVLTYLEYVSNLFMLFNRVSLRLGSHYYDTNITLAAKDNVRKILDWVNYAAKEIPEEEMVLVIEKNANVTAVAEITEPSAAFKVIQYNHYLLKGDIDAKRAILESIGQDLETKLIRLSDADIMLTESIFFLMNNLNIRRDNRNRKGPYYKDAVARMSLKKLEEWYDELYEMCLLAYLVLHQEDRYPRYKELKSQIEG